MGAFFRFVKFQIRDSGFGLGDFLNDLDFISSFS
jgi:hypothetical protein